MPCTLCTYCDAEANTTTNPTNPTTTVCTEQFLTWWGGCHNLGVAVADDISLEAQLQQGDAETALLYIHGAAHNVMLRGDNGKISMPHWSATRCLRYFVVDLTATTRTRTLVVDGVDACLLAPGFHLKNLGNQQ